jgi:hypothetical protein
MALCCRYSLQWCVAERMLPLLLLLLLLLLLPLLLLCSHQPRCV